MPTFRIEKTSNYSVISNNVIQDKNLSLTARGLMAFMLSLADDWDFSCKGLEVATNTKEATLRTALKELENNGYLKREPIRKNGRISDWVYWIYESPLGEKQQVEKQQVEILQVEKLVVENQVQKNTNIQSTKEISTKEISTNKKSTKEQKELPFINQETMESYQIYKEMRAKMRKPIVNDMKVFERLMQLSNGNENLMKEILDQSIVNGWQGLFELKGKSKGTDIDWMAIYGNGEI